MDGVEGVVHVVFDFDEVLRDEALDAEDVGAVSWLRRREEEGAER